MIQPIGSAFRPMLASQCKDVTKLKFPVLVSIKLDGVRCVVINSRLMSRSLKEIPNHLVQEMFAGVPNGSDGELIVGDPTAPDAYRKTVSAVMGDGNDIAGLRYHIFDNFQQNGGFEDRSAFVKKFKYNNSAVQVLPHFWLDDVESLTAFETEAVEAGNEGIMVRSLNGPYKNGRSTEKEGYLLKIKRFEDTEAVVIGFEERMHNGNEAKTNALGRTERSSNQENLTGRGDLGKLVVRGVGGTYDGVEFGVGTGFDDADRAEIWSRRSYYIGRLAKVKYFPLGSKDKPRFPVWLGWRDKIDTGE
jgi:DNA ligase-1